MADDNPLGPEDQRKLHAEVNQILNQRFLLTTAAITVFGVFSSWMIPKNPLQNPAVLDKLVFAGAALLHLFLWLLFLWNRFLAALQSYITIYLALTGASKWEADWKKFHPRRRLLSTGVIQNGVFLMLWVFTLIWQVVILKAYGLELLPLLKSGWFWFEVGVTAIYLTSVFGFGFGRWLKREKQTEEQWREILGLPSLNSTSTHKTAPPMSNGITWNEENSPSARNLKKELIEKCREARREYKCHFGAADICRKKHKWFGILAMTLALVAGSGFAYEVTYSMPSIKWASSLLALLSALFSGLITFGKYVDRAKQHYQAGRQWEKWRDDCSRLILKIDAEDADSAFKSWLNEYQKLSDARATIRKGGVECPGRLFKKLEHIKDKVEFGG